MDLKTYISKHGIKASATKLGITPRAAAAYKYGERWPHLRELARIVDASDGEIDPVMVMRSAATKHDRSAA